jgi:hypothetical protein
METRRTIVVIIAIVAVLAIASTARLAAPVHAACSGNPHDRDSGTSGNPHDRDKNFKNLENGNPHDLIPDFLHHQSESCPGTK